jgi:hypothetical protein
MDFESRTFVTIGTFSRSTVHCVKQVGSRLRSFSRPFPPVNLKHFRFEELQNLPFRPARIEKVRENGIPVDFPSHAHLCAQHDPMRSQTVRLEDDHRDIIEGVMGRQESEYRIRSPVTQRYNLSE